MSGRDLSLSMSPTLEHYKQDLKKFDPQRTPEKRNFIKKGLYVLVSKERKRFKNNKYDLDLTYITDRIIAMAYPGEGIQGLYRNKMSEVQGFLENYHKDHYKVYNFSTEHYNAANFRDRVANFPFKEGDTPSLKELTTFVQDINAWLDADDKNVGVVHCKDGQQRTGVMVSALLTVRYKDKGITIEDAKKFFFERRTKDAKHLLSPAQEKFLDYFIKHEKEDTSKPKEEKTKEEETKEEKANVDVEKAIEND